MVRVHGLCIMEGIVKAILSYEELIMHMKKKGIRFDIINEQKAKDFLEKGNFYMNLASYRKNYAKCNGGKRHGQYQNLDFAYLMELSAIDSILRQLLMRMCLDIERAIKIRLVSDCTANADEDGYRIVREYLSSEDHNFSMLRAVNSNKSGEYCRDLIESYYPFFPIWVLVEVISFGGLLHICDFYDQRYSRSVLLGVDAKFMNTVRDFRNASAHSNCLLNHITRPLDSTKQPDSRITTFVKTIGAGRISSASRAKYLGMSFPYNVTTLLYVYDIFIDDATKKESYGNIRSFLTERVVLHRDYFKSNPSLCGVYHFFDKLLDNIYQKVVN